jgi:hypothetical protein
MRGHEETFIRNASMRNWTSCTTNYPNYDNKIVLGEVFYKPTIGIHSPHEKSSKNGVRLINFAAARNLRIIGSILPHKRIHQFLHKLQNIERQIDHVLIERRDMNCVRDIRNCKKAVIGSDHYLILLKFTAQLPKPPWKERTASKRFDIPKLKDPIARQQFNECIEEKLNEAKEAWTSDVDADWSLLSSAITEVAEEVLGRPPVTERKDWFDEESRRRRDEQRKRRCIICPIASGHNKGQLMKLARITGPSTASAIVSSGGRGGST